MARRRRRRAKSAPKVTRRRRKRNPAGSPRVARANPRRRRKRARRRNPRVVAANPRRRRRRARRRNPARAVAANPRRRRRRSRRNPFAARVVRSNPRRRRRSRRNPLPAWASVGVAALLGIGGFALASVGSFAATKQLDPSMESLTRNRWIAGGLVALGGIALAMKSRNPLIEKTGIALAASGAVFAGGSTVSALVGNAVGQGMAGLGAIVNRSQVAQAIQGGAFPYRRMNGGMGAVSNDPTFGMGEVALATIPPWQYGRLSPV